MASEKVVPAATPDAAAPRERVAATIRYIDRPELTETFADAISGLVFDGQSLRIEFAVTRLDEVKPNSPISGRRYPACRLVLPPAAAIDLINRMQQIGTALTQAGVARRRRGAANRRFDQLGFFCAALGCAAAANFKSATKSRYAACRSLSSPMRNSAAGWMVTTSRVPSAMSIA